MNYPPAFVEWYNRVKTIQEMPPIDIAYAQHLSDEQHEQSKKAAAKSSADAQKDQDYRFAMMNNAHGS